MLRTAPRSAAVLAALLLSCPVLPAQPAQLSWDGDLSTAGTLENSAGTWNLTDLRWYNGTGYQAWDTAAIAQFGSTASNAGAAITLNESITLAGMNFLPLQGTSLPSANLAYSFSGTGSLNFLPGSVITVANVASNGGSGFIRFNTNMVAHDLKFVKSEGTVLGYVGLNVAMPGLTGTLTLDRAEGVTGGMYATLNHTRLPNVTRLIVGAGSVASIGGGGTILLPITIGGEGSSNWGPIRVESSNSNFAGGIELTSDARFHTHINVLNASISAPITETEGGSKAFRRTAYSPVNTILPLGTTYSAGNTYTGTTSFGRSFGQANTTESVGTEGGLNILDFSAATAPDNNIFYHGVAESSLTMFGGLATTTVMRVNGAAGETNTQTFTGLSVQHGSTAIEVNSGNNGSVILNLGEITRADLSALAIRGPSSGAITGTYEGQTDAVLGPWATYTNANGSISTWAALQGGAITSFTGTEDHVTGLTVTGSATSHLRISEASAGAVETGAGVTDLATVSMTDATAERSLAIGAGNTLRLGLTGGIQMTGGAQALTLGSLADTSVLTAGGQPDAAGQLVLTNLSAAAPLTIHSSLRNNGSGALSVMLNGTGRTVLTGTNTFTGMLAVHSGVLEVQSNGALGASGTGSITKIMTGASLNLSGGIVLGETIHANGHGIAQDGAIRNLSGNNTISTAVRIQSSTRIVSDSGTLVLGGIASQIGATAMFFSGAGDIEVRGNITNTSGIFSKDGRGTLTLSGTNNYTSVTTVLNGRLNLNFAGATAPATNLVYTGITVGGTALSNSAELWVTGKPGATNSQSFSTLTFSTTGSFQIGASQNSATSLSLAFTGAITRPAGVTLNFTLPTTGAITTTTGTDNALFTGTGGVAYATVGLDDWAATKPAVGGVRAIAPLATINGYTLSTASGLFGNADIAAGITSTTLTANTAISSLRFDQPQATTIGQAASGLILTTGGILVTPDVGANDTVINLTGLRAPASAADLVIIQNNTQGILKVTGKILNNAGGTAAGLTKGGPGALVLETPAGYLAGDYSGATRILDGTLHIVSGTGSAMTYPIFYSTIFTLGSGDKSGRLVIGSGTGTVSQYGGLRTDGVGTANAVVAGTSSMSTFLTYTGGTHDFRKGFIGGPGVNENNLNLTISVGTTQLGPNNTYIGKTSIARDVVEVTKLANYGEPSSLGTGTLSAAARIIDIANMTTSAVNYTTNATLRYIGSEDSVTNRPLALVNNDVETDIVQVNAYLENTGTGTVKFTSQFTNSGSNTAMRSFTLGGTNTGFNEIVGITDLVTHPMAGGLSLKKEGTGTWVLTGNSTYDANTYVNAGTLLVRNAGSTGSATGLGSVDVQVGATLGGSGRIAPAEYSVNFFGGTLSVGGSHQTAQPETLEIIVSEYAGLWFQYGSTVKLDIFERPTYVFASSEAGNNGLGADQLVVGGYVDLGMDTLLEISNPNGITDFQAGDSWQIFDWSGLSEPVYTTFAETRLPDLAPGLVWDLSQLYTDGFLSVAFVPEPARGLLLVGAFGCMLLRRRRGRSLA